MKALFHSQNLNEKNGKVVGSKFWNGRAWYHAKREIHWEWSFWKHARAFHFKIHLCDGDGDDGLMIIAGIPFLFDFYFGIEGLFKSGKETVYGVAIHNNSFWLYPGNYANEWNTKDPWHRKHHSWDFPWIYDWYSTEILEHKANLPGFAKTIWMDNKDNRRTGGGGLCQSINQQESAAKTVQETYLYTYTRKNGEVQQRKATVHVERMTWRMKWWPLLPFKKSRTSIDIAFSEEVGEGTGSWKGGTTGCGYDMLHGETPYQCLKRMERERKFGR